MKHVGAVHSHEASFHITCGVSGCPCMYKKHMFQKHREIMEVNEASEAGCEPEHQALEASGSDEDVSESPCFLVRACSCFVCQIASYFRIVQMKVMCLENL